MKKNRKFIFFAIILSGVAFWLIINNRKSTISEELRDFGTKDTASIVKVFIADKKGEKVMLEKQQDGTWTINQKNMARPDAISTMLTTIHDIEVRSPVGKSAHNNIVKAIAANGIKVELYNAQGKFKTYYVGGPTQDQLGTFMYLENSTVPFIVHIPGFEGYLTPRYSTRTEDWLLKNVFLLGEGQLDKLTVTDRQNSDRSFTISNEANQYKVFDKDGKETGSVSQDKIINYLQYYRIINYEMNERSLSVNQKDSLLLTPPFRSIVLKTKEGKSSSIDLWRRPVTSSTQVKENASGEPFRFDVDRMTARLNGDTALVVVQYFSFEKLFVRPVDFIARPQ